MERFSGETFLSGRMGRDILLYFAAVCKYYGKGGQDELGMDIDSGAAHDFIR